VEGRGTAGLELRGGGARWGGEVVVVVVMVMELRENEPNINH
jgi:hypothetical protein